MESSSDGRLPKRRQSSETPSGPAWGAQSSSAVKNQAINKAVKDSGKDPGFGDFGRYFSEKKRKLREQFNEDASTSLFRDIPAGTLAQHIAGANKPSSCTDPGKVNKELFKGVSIFVDGFTTPTHQELRFIMMNYGGLFQNYFSSQRVTHIICSTLPDSKIMNPRSMSRGLPIVKPEWIVDSMKENRLLAWGKYQLERIAYSHPNQQTLSASFSAQKLDGSSPATAKVVKVIDAAPHNMEEKDPECDPVNETLSPASVSVDKADKYSVTKPLEVENTNMLEDTTNFRDRGTLFAESNLQDRTKSEPELISESSRGIMHNQDVNTSAPVKQPNQKAVNRQGHSTLNDPDFVQSYFKYSRLHFIGTWRNRYQNLLNAGSFGKPEQAVNTDLKLPDTSSSGRPVIIHLDMDCFFVSVVIRNRPDLTGKPVAVCHSDSAIGTGEISSANYPARSYGIKAGMFVRDAKACCPELAILPYDFSAYEQVADKVYSILHRHCSTVQAVSCDEAFLDCSGHPEPVNLASRIREEIFQATQCTASAGIAQNLLLARLATKKAKPNGQYFIQDHEVKQFMAALPLDELPGVGWTLREKLHGHGLHTCAELQSISKEVLQKDYGVKTGLMLWSYAQGVDEREVQPAQERKSIGAEVNWGVRFSCADDAQQFLVTLSNEVATRLQSAASCGRTITLKVKKRKEGAGEPTKFMGCGICDNLSRSETVGYPTNSADVLLRIGCQLFASLHLDVEEVRGVGLQVSRLESANTGKKKQYNALDSWLAPPRKLNSGKELMNQITENIQHVNNAARPKRADNHCGLSSPCQNSPEGLMELREPGPSNLQPVATGVRQALGEVQRQNRTHDKSSNKTHSNSLELPPFSQLDRSVLECLPEDILAEITDYDRARELLRPRAHVNRKPDCQPLTMSNAQKPRGGRFQNNIRKNKTNTTNTLLELPPVSQLDPSVLESLPEDILAEINQAYHQELLRKPSRGQSSSFHSNLNSFLPKDTARLKDENPASIPDIISRDFGSSSSFEQPRNTSSNLDSTAEDCYVQTSPMKEYEDYYTVLETMIENVNSGQPSQSLSSSLVSLGSFSPILDARDIAGLQKPIRRLVKLLIQYIQAITSKDLEEVHLILLYMKRLGSRCLLWKSVQELAMPAVKGIIRELYGGEFALD